MRLLAFLVIAAISQGLFAAPDEGLLGKAEGYPICVRAELSETRCLIGAVSHYDEIFTARKVAKAETPRPLKRAASEPKLRYSIDLYRGDLDDYLSRNRTTGLLIMQGDTILVERYQYDRKPEDRMNSYSMAKTIVAMLVGIAVADGKIASIDDRADKYVAELKGSPYGETPIRHLLTMSSGVRFNENYQAESDINVLGRNTIGQQGEGGAAALAPFRTREVPPGQRYSYASSETQVLGLVLRAATGRNLSEYLSEKIWQPMGAEADAAWVIDKGGYEAAYAAFNATLRDYARFGLLLANDGARDGKQIIPAQWVREATTVQGPHLKYGLVDGYFGYGFQTRVLPGPNRRFVALGLRGQAIYVDPSSKVVMVHTAARDTRADAGYREQNVFWNSIDAQLSKQPQ